MSLHVSEVQSLCCWNIIPLYGFLCYSLLNAVDGPLNYLKLGAVTNKGVKNIYRQIFIWT